jgi:hypothetical protein
MANLINVSATETLVKGTYLSDKYKYSLQYTHSEGKVKSMRIEVMDKDNNTFAGSANFSDNNNSVVVRDQSMLSAVTDVVTDIYNEAVASVATPPAPATPAEPTDSDKPADPTEPSDSTDTTEATDPKEPKD